MDTIEIHGSVERITYRNKDNGYTVLKLKTDNDVLTATGIMPFVTEGDIITLYGNYFMHHNYGKQFKCDLCEVSIPETQSQILRYLSSGAIKGIGPATAIKIVKEFREDSLNIIESHPAQLAQIKGISLDKAIEISEQYKKQHGVRDIIINLAKYKISLCEATDIFKVLGARSLEIIKSNPYVLCGDGINLSFERADEIAASFSVQFDNVFRITAGIEYVLKKNLQNGHTCLPRRKLADVSAQMLDVDSHLIDDCIEIAVDSFRLYKCILDNEEYISLPEYAATEQYINSRIKTAINSNMKIFDISEFELNFVQDKLGIVFDETQINAVNEAMRNSLFVLTGGPGTGKTTTLNAIIEIFDNRNMSVALAAPTGRAAKRMTELTGKNAVTIHRLLEAEWESDSKSYFSKNKKNPLDYDVIIVDEMSMVDVNLFKALLEAVRLSSRIILVGDSDQLPSVGAGNVLNDLIESEQVPYVKLKKIYRQAQQSAIITFSHDIINGQVPSDFDKAEDFFFLKRFDAESTLNTVIQRCATRLPNAYGYSAFNDIQVLCPSRKGVCGTVNLNSVLQNVLNPFKENAPEIRFKENVFRLGDKVMHIKNDYDIPWDSNSGETGLGVYNGDIGFIEEIDLSNRLIKVRFDDKIATYYEENLGLLELAYAVTVHKSQGCEFNCVIIPLIDTYKQLRYRKLLYTAITRAKNMLILVGDISVYEDMILNDRKTLRYTALKHLLTDGIE